MNNLFPLEYNSLDLFGQFWLCLLVSIVHLWILHLTTLAGHWPVVSHSGQSTLCELELRQLEGHLKGDKHTWQFGTKCNIFQRTECGAEAHDGQECQVFQFGGDQKQCLHWGQQFSRCRGKARNIWRVREMAKWAKWVKIQQIEVHEIKSRRWKTGLGWVGWRSDWVGGWWGRRQPRHWAKWLEHSFPPPLHHSACHPNHIILHHTPPPPPFPPSSTYFSSSSSNCSSTYFSSHSSTSSSTSISEHVILHYVFDPPYCCSSLHCHFQFFFFKLC